MKRITRASAAFVALIGALGLSLAACTPDAPSAPTAPNVIAPSQPPSDLLELDIDLGETVSGLGETVSGLLNLSVFRCETPAYGTVTQTVGRDGGFIKVGPHSLYVPAGALGESVSITATAKAGNQVKVDFQPEGLQFRYPALLTLSYAHCASQPRRPRVVHVDDLLSILELLPSLNDRSGERVTGKLDHFSGYAFAD